MHHFIKGVQAQNFGRSILSSVGGHGQDMYQQLEGGFGATNQILSNIFWDMNFKFVLSIISINIKRLTNLQNQCKYGFRKFTNHGGFLI